MTIRALVVAAGIATTAPLPAQAQRQAVEIDIPAGPLGNAVDALARATGHSVVLADPALWSRRVARVRGRMTIAQALAQLARHGDIRVARIGATGWRLTRKPVPMRAPPRAAPPPPPADGGDVVVIASKRAVSRRSFAASVVRLTDPILAIDAGSQAIVNATTVVSSTYRGAGREKLFIRGIADSSFAGLAQSVTGLYFGDLRLGFGAADPDLQLHDMESVEVLQGPQGTLYGSGSLAGIIRLNPNMPATDAAAAAVGGGVTLTADGAPGADVDLMLNLPLSDAAAVRVVGYARRAGGFVDRPAVGRDTNRTDIAGGRAMLRHEIAPGWTVDGIVLHQSIAGADGQYVAADGPRLTNPRPLREPFSSRYSAGQIVVNGRIGELRLTSSTGIARQSLAERFQAFADPELGIATLDLTRRSQLLLHETRLARTGDDGTGWVAGVSYTRDVTTTSRRDVDPFFDGIDVVENRNREIAVFGEAGVRLTRWLTVGGGGRLLDARAEGRRLAGVDAADDDEFMRRRGRWLLPSASLTATIAPNLSAFVRHQQGVRAGTLMIGQGRDARVAPDRMRSIEGGLRFRRRGMIEAELAIVHTNWTDVQADYRDELGGVFVGNVGDGRIRSVSLDVRWQPTSSLDLDGAILVNDARLTDPALVSTQPGSGAAPLSQVFLPGSRTRRLPDVADVVARGAIRYRRRIAAAWDATVRIWARHDGAALAAIGPSPVGSYGRYTATGALVEVQHRSDTFSLAVDNLTNAAGPRFLLGSSTFARQGYPTPLRPISARIGFARRF